MSEKIRLTGECIKVNAGENGIILDPYEATIELEPPDLSQLKEGDAVLVKVKVLNPNYDKDEDNDTFQTTVGWFNRRRDIVAILPKEEKYIKCKNCGAISPKNYKLCYCGKDKEQPKEMPFVKQYGDCEEACIERIIKCVEDLQDRIKKMEEKADEAK